MNKKSIAKKSKEKKSELWTEILICNMTIKGNFIIMKKKFHIIFNLLCFVILNTNFMKFFDIVFIWRKKKTRRDDHSKKSLSRNSNHKNEIFLTKKIDFFKNKSESKKRQINVYAKKSMMLNHAQKKMWKLNTNFWLLRVMFLNQFKKSIWTFFHVFSKFTSLYRTSVMSSRWSILRKRSRKSIRNNFLNVFENSKRSNFFLSA